jgi:nucleoside-diphosphate-sugar epimerase
VSQKYSYIVTGGSGMVGKRLLQMLIDGGAKKVTSIDIIPTPNDQRLPSVNYLVCDIGSLPDLKESTKGHDIMIHTAALVGPFHPSDKYTQVNFLGTINVIEACKANKIKVLVDCSSPSTRMDGSDILGKESSQLKYAEGSYVHEYARTKAVGEMAVLAANSESLRTCAVAPHQVYGEEDKLFLPSVIKAAQSGFLRVFGDAENLVSFTHVDNIAYALHLAGNTLMGQNYKAVAGKFYVVTDGDAQYFWKAIDEGCQKLGFGSILKKKFIGKYLATFIGYFVGFVSMVTGLNTKITPFSVKMMMNNRYFSIKEAQRDMGYEPITKFEEKWNSSVKAIYKNINQ